MRIPRLLVTVPIADGTDYLLDGAPFQHAVKVLRLGRGAKVILFDGNGSEWQGVLDDVGRESARVRLESRHEVNREPPLRWELVQGISRGERMDYTLQKSVELGVAAIHPVETKRSMVKLQGSRAEKRLEHWQGIVKSACEQCGRTRVPPIHRIASIAQFFQTPPHGLLLLLDPEGDCAVNDLPADPPDRVLLLAGPEGGFDPCERAAAYQAGARGLRLGPRILRTETAAMVAAALLLNRWGDFI